MGEDMIRFSAETKDHLEATTAWIGMNLPEIRAETFWFQFPAGSRWAAKLLVNHIARTLFERMKALRAEAYAEGWADAKAKRAKASWFSGSGP